MLLKRCFDLFFGILALVLLSPILIFIGLLIKAESVGPILFRQERVGRNGVIFEIHKFRSMVHTNSFPRKSITVEGDIRITKLGGFLRKYKLDELPQLIDVVNGSMSFVGPRPEIPYYVDYYPKEIKEIVLSVRPGLTDLASIAFRDESLMLAKTSDPYREYTEIIIPKKLEFYIDYVSNRTFFGDISIMIKTLHKIIH